MPPRRRSFEENTHRRAFGERVRELRLNRGYSQQALAELAGLDRSYVNGAENGHRNVSLDSIHALATAMGVEAADLFARGPKKHGAFCAHHVVRVLPGNPVEEMWVKVFERCPQFRGSLWYYAESPTYDDAMAPAPVQAFWAKRPHSRTHRA